MASSFLSDFDVYTLSQICFVFWDIMSYFVLYLHRELENVSVSVHAQPRPKKVELDEINFVSSTLSLTAMDSSHLEYGTGDDDDVDDNEVEYSIQCHDDEFTEFSTDNYQNTSQWMADNYESNWRRSTVDFSQFTVSISRPQ